MPVALIAETDVGDAERLRKLLASEGVESVVLISAEEIASTPRQYDLAFVTWDLPILDQCRRRWPSMPVVIVSDRWAAELAVLATRLGASDFLEKPVHLDIERFSECVRTLIKPYDSLASRISELRNARLGPNGHQLIGASPEFLAMLRNLASVLSDADCAVLITGEHGTGKELVALALHELGERKGKPWIAKNVAAIPLTLIESELFGQEKGAFTDARERMGLLEEASNGTLFLDEIGDLGLDLQPKLLRAIETKIFQRVGGNTNIHFRARLIFATNRNLQREVNAGRFRGDLLSRMSPYKICVPPLRERIDDLDALVEHFLKRYAGGRRVTVARETKRILKSYPFPGNIRELDNMVRAALIKVATDPPPHMIVPRHLDLVTMGDVLTPMAEPHLHIVPTPLEPQSACLHLNLPARLLEKRYRDAWAVVEQAFDQLYFSPLLKRAGSTWESVKHRSGLDVKTVKKHCRNCGLQQPSDEKAE